MRIDVLTLFPKMFENVLNESMLKRSQVKGLVEISVHNLRDWTFDSHKTADDKPFGGGPGMVMKVEPVYRALKELGVKGPGLRARGSKKNAYIILLTPQGKRLEQRVARRFAKCKRIVLICGHYEGVDERIRSFADEEISIGDYVLTCGELPAMVLIDSMVRLVPGVLGDKGSLESESFEDGLLEYPQYTRPAVFEGMKVPDVLLGGNHKKIEEWRMQESLKRTKERRPDILRAKNDRRK